MKCPNDQTEMERGTVFIGIASCTWNKNGYRLKLYAYRCPKCEKVELSTKD